MASNRIWTGKCYMTYTNVSPVCHVLRFLTFDFVGSSLSCKRCIIVGNGGILSKKSLGSLIDQYDVVVR